MAQVISVRSFLFLGGDLCSGLSKHSTEITWSFLHTITHRHVLCQRDQEHLRRPLAVMKQRGFD